MKVLIVHCGKGIYGGAELVIVELYQYLWEKGHRAVIVGKDLPNEILGKQQTMYGITNTHSYFELRKEVHKRLSQTDVINVHNFPATLAPFPTKKPIVWMCNEPAELFTNWWRKPIEAVNRWWVKKSGMKVVVADRFNAERFERIYGVKPTIIPYGVDYEFWSNHIREKDDGSGFGMLQVGTITPYKNQEASIRAVASLKEDVPNLELVLAGPTNSDKRYYEKMKELVVELDVRDRVNFTGNLDREQLREWYYKADVLLHPVKEQGGWLVPFESICAGLPVVVSQEFTGADIIRDNELGIVTNDYANVIKHGVVGYQQPWDEITEEARKWVRENLSWERYGKGMLEVFEGVSR